MTKSAKALTVVFSWAELLFAVLSWSEASCTLFPYATLFRSLLAVTFTVMVQVPFLASEALVQSTALRLLAEQLPALEASPVTVNWEGTVSVTCRPVAVEGPELDTVRV